MIDGVIREEGNSRLMRSSISEDTTWEQFKAMLIAGTLPFDMMLNIAGWQVIGTMLGKANLLSDDTGSSIGFDPAENPTVNDAIYRLMALIGAKSFQNALEDVELECNTVTGSGYVDYTFKKPFTDTPVVIAFNGTTLQATANVNALTMQVYAPASFIAIYDGGVL